MKILITGSKGFVGSHLKERLKKEHEIIDCDLPECDLRKELPKADFIFHLGAKAIVGDAEQSPTETFDVNIMGTLNVLEMARKHNIKTIICSTDKVYGYQPGELPYMESAPLRPIGIYATSKASADLIAQSYIRVFKAPIIIVRPCNIFGYDTNKSRLIPEVIMKCLKNEAIVLRSNGTPKREYIYIDDMIDAYVKLMKNFEEFKNNIFNIGTGEVYSVLEVVRKIMKIMDCDVQIDVQGTAKNEIQAQYLSTYFKFRWGWKPKHTFEEGIRKTIESYRQDNLR